MNDCIKDNIPKDITELDIPNLGEFASLNPDWDLFRKALGLEGPEFTPRLIFTHPGIRKRLRKIPESGPRTLKEKLREEFLKLFEGSTVHSRKFGGQVRLNDNFLDVSIKGLNDYIETFIDSWDSRENKGQEPKIVRYTKSRHLVLASWFSWRLNFEMKNSLDAIESDSEIIDELNNPKRSQNWLLDYFENSRFTYKKAIGFELTANDIRARIKKDNAPT